MDQSRSRVALLIDGENSASTCIDLLWVEAEKLGEVIIRRVYGNWSLPHMQGWYEPTIRYGLEQRHHGRTAVGKNATDIALTVDAMDILHCHLVQHFCLATSDSDYTPLVTRLRAAGCTVLIAGKASTPEVLKRSGTTFITIDQEISLEVHPTSSAKSTSPGSQKLLDKEELLTRFLHAYDKEIARGDNGWVRLSSLGMVLKQDNHQLHLSRYGYKSLHAFVQAHTNQFETRRQTSKGKPILIRRKVKPSPDLIDTLSQSKPISIPVLASLLIQAYTIATTKLQNAWVPIPNLSVAIKQLNPAFTPRAYGYKNLPALVQHATDVFQTRKQTEGKSHHIEVWLLAEHSL